MANRWPSWIEATVTKPALQDFGATAKVTTLDLVVTPKTAARIVGMWTLDVENIGGAAGQFILDQYLGGVIHRAGPAPAAIPVGLRFEVTTIGTYDIAAGVAATLEIYAAGVGTTFRVHAARSMATFFGMPSQGVSF